MYLVIVLIIVIIYLLYIQHKTTDDFMHGMWKCDPEFCEQSEVDGVLLYIGDREKGLKSYIIMTKDDEVSVNEQLTLHPCMGYNKMTIDYCEDSVLAEALPEHIQITVDIPKGQMIWHDDEKKYFVFYKSHINT